MKILHVCLILGISLAVTACSQQNTKNNAVQDTGKLNLVSKRPEDVFDKESAKLINCAEFGLLSELGIGAGTACGFMDKTGLVKFTPKFMSLDFVAPGDKTTCLPIYRGDEVSGYQHFGWFYITKNGYGRGHDENYDNDCARWEFLPKLAKTYVSGKLAYMDKSMMIVHQTNYPYGENFYGEDLSQETNLAIVCSERPKKRLGPYKEHFAYMDGKCGKINLEFEVVTPIEQSYEELRPLPEWAIPNYTRSAYIIAKSGKAEELRVILRKAFEDLPGLTRVEVYGNQHDPDVVFVHERWVSRSAHTESLKSPKVQAAIKHGRALIETIKQSDYEYDPENGKY